MKKIRLDDLLVFKEYWVIGYGGCTKVEVSSMIGDTSDGAFIDDKGNLWDGQNEPVTVLVKNPAMNEQDFLTKFFAP